MDKLGKRKLFNISSDQSQNFKKLLIEIINEGNNRKLVNILSAFPDLMKQSLNFVFTCDDKKTEYSLLTLAIHNNNKHIIITLLENGWCPNFEPKNGLSPIFMSILNMNYLVVELLFEFGVDFQKLDKHGLTPLFFAIDNKSYEIARFLIYNGCDINQKDLNDISMLSIFAQGGNIEAVSFLIGHNANLNDHNGFSYALEQAAKNHQLPMLVFLLANGAVLNPQLDFDFDSKVSLVIDKYKNPDLLGIIEKVKLDNYDFYESYFQKLIYELSDVTIDEKKLEVIFNKFEDHIESAIVSDEIFLPSAKCRQQNSEDESFYEEDTSLDQEDWVGLISNCDDKAQDIFKM